MELSVERKKAHIVAFSNEIHKKCESHLRFTVLCISAKNGDFHRPQNALFKIKKSNFCCPKFEKLFVAPVKNLSASIFIPKNAHLGQ